MINLLIDALIALVKFRAFPDRAASPADSPPVVDGVAQPAGAGIDLLSAAGAGGHPHWHPASWTDSDLLTAAAELLCWLPSHPGFGPRSVEGADNIRRELNRRAAQFRAEND